MKTDAHLLQYLAIFFVEWDTLRTKVIEKIKTHILCSVTVVEHFSYICLLGLLTSVTGGS